MENTRMIPVTAVGSGRLSVPPPASGAAVERAGGPPAAHPAAWPEDTVEIKGAAVAGPVEVIDDPHVAEVRQQIMAGTYLTPEKLEYVADRLWEVLNVGGANALKP
jgi:hypothetical protein